MATAFHRNTMTNTEGGTDDEEFRVAAIKDRVDTTMQVWMGLTMGCAKCHSHKYDPITNDEYYRFYAIFNQTADTDQPDESPVIPAPTPEITQRRNQVNQKIRELNQKIDSHKLAGHFRSIAPELKPLRDEIAQLEKERPEIPTLPVMVELSKEKLRVTKVLRKGNFLDPGDRVQADVPKALHALSPGATVNRLTLAKWLVDRANPLTARVAVNRYWAQLFGSGIVETEEDFGTQGELPSHPELLDWLAVRYMDLGWNTKAMLKLIVTSATYRQSSRVTPSLLTRDPRNRLLAHAPRVRLDGSRPGPLTQRALESQDRRAQCLSAPAGGALAGGLQRPADLGHEYGRRPVPPRAVHVLEANRPVSIDGYVRCPKPRALLHQAGADQHPASGIRDTE
jgi:hypothetical protein